MRDYFIKVFEKRVQKNDNTILITADLGFGVLDNFRKKYPKKYINVGVSEQNMIGLATGLSKKGYNVFCYSLGNFPTMRCLEQIRNDAAYHQANIKIINVGGGYSYGQLGFSHHSTEDLSYMRSIPNIKIVCPASRLDTEKLTDQIFSKKGVFYLRLDKKREELKHNKKYKTTFGKISKIKSGKKIAFFVIGGILNEVIKATNILEQNSISSSIYNCHTLKPFDKKFISIAKRYKNIAIVEENNILGGLNGEISEKLIKNNAPKINYINFGIKDNFQKKVGDRDYLIKQNKLDYLNISKRVLNFLKKK